MIDLRKAPPELFAQVLDSNLQGIGATRKLYGHFADAVQLRLGAECAWVMGEDAEVRIVRGDEALCDFARGAAFLRDERLPTTRTAVLAKVSVHGRQVAVVGVARRERELGQASRRTLDRLCGVLARELERREEARLTKVLDRIRGKIVSELRPRDLAYQILDSLHQLVDYDHSSALLTYDPAAAVFRIDAEKMVWTKGKSAFVGLEIPADGLVGALGDHPGIRRLTPPAGGVDDPLWEALNYHRGRGMPTPSSLICAPLFFGGGGGELLGLLKIATWKRRPFDAWDGAVVERFLPAAAVSIRNARLNMSLEQQAIQAELKATLVTLASAVAHDVNNAVGTILPLAQQIRAELREGLVDPATLDGDLELVVEKAQLCKRIFGNMLRVARGGRSGDGPVDVNQVVRETVPFFHGAAARRGIETVLDLAPELPPVRFSRHDLHHIVLNLVNNSLEAMAEVGSRVVIATRRVGDAEARLTALLIVADDGPGIPPELLDKVQEPFFSTKHGGVGLGLAICRSLAWQNGGGLEVSSVAVGTGGDDVSGHGTRVEVELRLASEEAAA
jgi:signal transduction histidine kinase